MTEPIEVTVLVAAMQKFHDEHVVTMRPFDVAILTDAIALVRRVGAPHSPRWEIIDFGNPSLLACTQPYCGHSPAWAVSRTGRHPGDERGFVGEALCAEHRSEATMSGKLVAA